MQRSHGPRVTYDFAKYTSHFRTDAKAIATLHESFAKREGFFHRVVRSHAKREAEAENARLSGRSKTKAKMNANAKAKPKSKAKAKTK